MSARQPALLLLGPTGSGKTPLGDLWEQRGWAEHRCLHFDFGAQLRQVAERTEPDIVVSAADIQFVRRVLETNALLEDRDFPLAVRLLASFLNVRDADADTIVLMNGLPRHVGQARALAEFLEVRAVVLLECPAETVRQRIAGNAGGDRAHRIDDQAEAVERKLSIYAERTAPLVDYYREVGAEIVSIAVTSTMEAEEMWRRCVAALTQQTR